MPIIRGEQNRPPEGWDVPDIIKPPAEPTVASVAPVSLFRFSDPIPLPQVATRPPAWKALDFSSRFGHVDQASNSLLPPSHVLALGESGLQDADLRSASRLLARQYDLPVGWFFKQYAGMDGEFYVTPGGEVITAEQARSIIRPQEPKVLRDILAPMFGPDERIDVNPPGRKRQQSFYARPSLQTAANVIDALISSHVSGSLTLPHLLGTATSIASRLDGVKGGAEAFRANMEVLKNANYGHWTIPVGIAEDAASKGITFQSVADVGARYGAPSSTNAPGLTPGEFRKRVRESSVQQIGLRVYQNQYFFYDPVSEKWSALPDNLAQEFGRSNYSAGIVASQGGAKLMNSPPDTWGMPANHPTTYGGDGVYRPPTEVQYASMGFLPGVGGLNLKRPQDWYKQSRIIAHQAVIDKQAWDNSFLGWSVHRVGDAANFVYRRTEGAVMGIATVGAYPFNLIRGTEYANRKFWQDAQHIDDIQSGKANLGGLVASSLDLPKSSGALLELGFATAADPFLIGARLAKGLRAGRSLVELTEVTRGGALSRAAYRARYGTVSQITANINKAVAEGMSAEAAVARFNPIAARIADRWTASVGRAILRPSKLWEGKSLVRFATETAWEAKRPLYNVISEKARTLLRVEGIDPEIAGRIEAAVSIAKRAGLSIDDAESKVRDLFAAGLGAKPLDPVFFNNLLREMDYKQAERITQVAHLSDTLKMSEPETLDALSKEFARYDRANAEARLGEIASSFPEGRIIQYELPYRSRSLSLRMGTNAIGGDTYLGRGVRALTTKIPTPRTEFEAGQFAEQTERKLRRSRVFSQSEIETITQKARGLAEATNPNREASMVRLHEQLQRETFNRIASEYGLPQSGVDVLYKSMTSEIDKVNAANAQAYDVKFVRDPETGEVSLHTVTSPVFETQLLNGYYTADPVMMRKAIRDAIGARRAIEQVVRHFNVVHYPEEELRLARGIGEPLTFPRTAGSTGLSPEGTKYLYHVTTPDAMGRISVEGLRPGANAAREAEQGARVFFASTPDKALTLTDAGREGDKMLLRVRRDATKAVQSETPGVQEFVSSTPVARDALEFYGADGNWHKFVTPQSTERDKWLAMLRAKARPLPEKAISTEARMGQVVGNVWQNIAHDHFIRYWKFGMVTRVGYIPRVVGDETIRSLLDIGIMNKMAAQGFVGRNAEHLANSGILPRGWFEHHYTLPTADGAGFDLTMKMPGALPHEAYANSKVTGFGQLYEGVADQMRQVAKGIESQEYGLVEPVRTLRGGTTMLSKKWTRAWLNSVNGQIAHGALGRMALEDIAGLAGRRLTADESAARIEKYLTDDRLGQAVAERMGWDSTDLADHAADAVDTARRYTMNDPKVAEAALRGRADPAMLRALVDNDITKLPPVSGMKAAISSGKGNVLKPIVDAAARSILQHPTNYLSRQPFFKSWYDRILRIQVENALAHGTVYRNATEADQTLARMEATARRFAIDRTTKVMFNLRDASRFSELLGFVSPFFQPFQEAFSVYGHLIRRNPALIGWARVAYNAATQSGFARKDDTGQEVVDLSVFGKMAGLLTMTGFHKGYHLTAPLTSFNLFFNNAFPLPTGKLAGSLSIPFPGLSPPLVAVAQALIKDESASRLSNWAYQYGPLNKQSLLPTWINNAITAVDPSWNENGYTAYTDDFLKLDQYMGISYKTKAEQVAAAVAQAKTFYRWKAGISFISPAGPTIKFPTDAVDTEFRDLVKRYTAQGKSWSDARDEFLKRHPDLWLFTIAKTVWQGHDEGLPGSFQSPSIPANALADKILALPGFRDFAKRFPAMAFAILPQAAFAQKDYDPDVFRKQLASGDRRYLTPAEFASSGEAQQGWSGYWHLRDAWDAWQESHNVPENSVEFQIHKDAFDKAVVDLRTRYPAFDDAFGTTSESAMDPRVDAYMRHVAKDPVLSDFPVGKALKSYLSSRDDLAKQMADQGITTITSVSASEAGLTKQYDTMVKGLEARYPDFTRVYDTFLRNDLMNIDATADKALDNLNPDTRKQVVGWEQHYNDLRSQLKLARSDAEKAPLYTEEAQWIDRAYTDYGKDNPVALWFRSQDYQTRQDYTRTAQTKPYIFLNRFEREEILHEPTNDFSEQAWQEVSKARDEITHLQNTDPNFSASAAYGQLDQYVAGLMKRDKTFAAQVQHANEWGWAFWNHGTFVKEPGPAGDAWRGLQNATHQIEQWAITNGLHGTVGSKEQVVQWNQAKSEVLDYVNRLGAFSPTFKRQWEAYDVNYTGNLIDVLVPDVFFPLGGGS